MGQITQHRGPERLLVVMPSWVGDVVMATPTLRALRGLYPDAHITALARNTVRPVIDGCPWIDRVSTIRQSKKGLLDNRRSNIFVLARRLAAGRFDTAVLLPNSFRSALLVRMAGITKRIGYDRDGRGGLLTDRLLPRRDGGQFVPVPTRDYYLGLARYLGATDPDPKMELFTRAEDDSLAGELVAKGGYEVGGGRQLVLLNPGANYGDAKIWHPERFAAVADRCVEEFGAAVAMSGSPKEREILEKVAGAARNPIMDLPRLGIDLTLLKSVVKMSSVMVTNDTGPRHIAAAFGVPVVSIFGPTDPSWTEIGFENERQVMVKVFCGPCQKKRCPLDHRCMTQISPEMVFDRTAELLRAVAAGSSGGTGRN